MNEMMKYIYGTLHDSERAICLISKNLKNQRTINNCLVLFMVLSAVKNTLDDIRYREQQERIEALEKRLEEQIQSKGE